MQDELEFRPETAEDQIGEGFPAFLNEPPQRATARISVAVPCMAGNSVTVVLEHSTNGMETETSVTTQGDPASDAHLASVLDIIKQII